MLSTPPSNTSKMFRDFCSKGPPHEAQAPMHLHIEAKPLQTANTVAAILVLPALASRGE